MIILQYSMTMQLVFPFCVVQVTAQAQRGSPSYWLFQLQWQTVGSWSLLDAFVVSTLQPLQSISSSSWLPALQGKHCPVLATPAGVRVIGITEWNLKDHPWAGMSPTRSACSRSQCIVWQKYWFLLGFIYSALIQGSKNCGKGESMTLV